MKLDMSKAYDGTNWIYMRLLIDPYWFQFASGELDHGLCHVSLFCNYAFFKLTRGLGQGYPLSSYLSLLVAKGFNITLITTKREGSIQGIQVGGLEYVTHLLFVDDVLLFAQSLVQETKFFQEILQLYHKAIEMEVNLQKLSISFNCLSEEARQRIIPLFHFRRVEILKIHHETQGLWY